MIKKVAHKARVGGKVLRDEGLLGFTIVALQFLQKHRKRAAKKPEGKNPIYTRVKYQDAIRADISKPLPAWKGTSKKRLTFNWIMSPPGKGSGGHLNAFRFIKFLEDAGHECRIYLYAQDGRGPISAILNVMGDSYPVLKATLGMQWLGDDNNMLPADGVFATSWETAYPAFNSPADARRFYFIQDFEPYFYPAGSFYSLAENTYKLGFYGVTAGGWLAKKLHTGYGMQTDHFDFGSDEQLYSYNNDGERKEVMCYVRPFTERRGFETCMMALELFHEQQPDYTINLAGWDVSEYDIPFPYVNLKTLELHELNTLYNRCAAALILSFTNMSLLPLEVLGSGTIPVVNEGENNSLVSNNPYIEYAPNDPVSLAKALSKVVTRKDGAAYAKKAAASVKKVGWAESGAKFVNIVERETRRHE